MHGRVLDSSRHSLFAFCWHLPRTLAVAVISLPRYFRALFIQLPSRGLLGNSAGIKRAGAEEPDAEARDNLERRRAELTSLLGYDGAELSEEERQQLGERMNEQLAEEFPSASLVETFAG